MHRLFQVEVTVFVTGSHRESFPCEYALAEALSKSEEGDHTLDWDNIATPSYEVRRSKHHRASITSISSGSKSMRASIAIKSYPKNRVCDSLDDALVFAEEILIARVKPEVLKKERQNCGKVDLEEEDGEKMTAEEELKLAAQYLENLAPPDEYVPESVRLILSKCVREEYQENETIWRQGDESFSAKLLLKGKLRASLDGNDISECVDIGNLLGYHVPKAN